MKYLHTMVRVHDLDASLKCYRDALGLVEVNRSEHEAGRFTLVYLAAPGDEDATVDEQRRRRRRSAARELENILNNLNELSIGSPVVHQEHGVGRYLGLQTLNVGGIEAEFLFAAIRIETQVVKQHTRIFRPARHFVEARRAQLIGVDVRFVDRRSDAGQCRKWLHVLHLFF